MAVSTFQRHPAPGVQHERRWWAEGAVVAGVDEVGRGAWAGPVTVAAVVLPPGQRIQRLRDSKVLDPPTRERIAGRLRAVGCGIGLGHASNHEVDRLGLSPALQLAAHRAVAALPVQPDALLLDGNWDFLDQHPAPRELIVGGDARAASVAAASIVAKVTRDALMRQADRRHPAFSFASNKGYPAPTHLAALESHGPTRLHRRSWRPVGAASQARLWDADGADVWGEASTPDDEHDAARRAGGSAVSPAAQR